MVRLSKNSSQIGKKENRKQASLMDGICVGLISTAILLITALPFVVSQREGFISIDCGATEDYNDTVTRIQWTNDTLYSKIGESSTLPLEIDADRELRTVRSFPTGMKNCYEISTTDNTKYLLRLRFLYANFDLKSSGQDQSMYLIIDNAIIQKFNPAGGTFNLEFIITAVSNVTSVCLGRVDRDPFVNSIELRELNQIMYPLANRGTILSIVHQNAMTEFDPTIVRFPWDPYDRFWLPRQFQNLNETSGNATACRTRDKVPVHVMEKGVKADGPIAVDGDIDGYEIALTVFFADFDNQGNRTMLSTLSSKRSNDQLETFGNESELSSSKCNFSTVKNSYTDSLRKTPYNLNVSISQNPSPSPGTLKGRLPPARGDFDEGIPRHGKFNPGGPQDVGEGFPGDSKKPVRGEDLDLRAASLTSSSPSPPALLNAWHVSTLHYRPKETTNTREFAIMRNIRDYFNITTQWTGDPCLPVNFTWDGVECNYHGPNATVKTVDLSEMSLNNTVPDFFTQLTSLRTLNLSNNDLYGELPDALFENHLLKVDYSNNPQLRRKVHGLTTTERNILIGIVVPVGIIALFVGFLVCRHIRGRTLKEYTRDTKQTQVPWSSPVPIVKKGPSHGYLQLSRNISN